MRREINIKRSIAIRVRRACTRFPILWRRVSDVVYGHLGTRGRIAIQMAARWAYKEDKSKGCAAIRRELISKLQDRYPANEKQVLLLVEHVSPRLSKITKALHDTGYHVTVLHSKVATDYHKDLDVAKKYCESLIHYEGLAQLLYLIIESRIPIIHYFTAPDDMSVAILLFQMREVLPKIVVERYDIFNGMVVRKKIEYKQEQYLIESADGLCCREYAGEFCKDELRFHMRRNPLLFWDYMDQACFFEKNDNELSICYAGGILTEEEDPNAPNACFLELAEKCEENKCHLHIYPSIWNDKRFTLYIEYEKRHKYFHVHKPVEHSRLYEELGKYDYGIHPIRKTYQDQAYLRRVTTDKHIYGATNKYFDYISAGIPMIGATPEKQTLDFEKTGMILRWTIEEFDFKELKRRRKDMRSSVIENRNYWMIENRISDLTDYYRKVLEEE